MSEFVTGTLTVTHQTGDWPCPFDNSWPYPAPPAYYYYTWPPTWPTEPTDCIGKAHVFECDHVETCKCGKVQRVMPKAKKAKA